MRLADRFRKAIAGSASQYNSDGPLQADPMALRNKNRFNTKLCPDNSPDNLLLNMQGRPLACLQTGLNILASQPLLGAADCRNIQPEPHMGCETYSTWVGNSLAFNSFLSAFDKIKRYMRVINIVSGLFLIAIGILFLTDTFKEINSYLNLLSNS
jgi:hypothetical protein